MLMNDEQKPMGRRYWLELMEGMVGGLDGWAGSQ